MLFVHVACQQCDPSTTEAFGLFIDDDAPLGHSDGAISHDCYLSFGLKIFSQTCHGVIKDYGGLISTKFVFMCQGIPYNIFQRSGFCLASQKLGYIPGSFST